MNMGLLYTVEKILRAIPKERINHKPLHNCNCKFIATSFCFGNAKHLKKSHLRDPYSIYLCDGIYSFPRLHLENTPVGFLLIQG